MNSLTNEVHEALKVRALAVSETAERGTLRMDHSRGRPFFISRALGNRGNFM
ncbi:MAG: hypothetical protein LBF05_06205 [Tannerella sp.]|nr:hypothetical protein [Tannerella sp.]